MAPLSATLDYLANQGIVDRLNILDGLSHPSAANAERIAYFLGQKPRDRLSAKTDPTRLNADRASLEATLKATLKAA